MKELSPKKNSTQRKNNYLEYEKSSPSWRVFIYKKSAHPIGERSNICYGKDDLIINYFTTLSTKVKKINPSP